MILYSSVRSTGGLRRQTHVQEKFFGSSRPALELSDNLSPIAAPTRSNTWPSFRGLVVGRVRLFRPIWTHGTTQPPTVGAVLCVTLRTTPQLEERFMCSRFLRTLDNPRGLRFGLDCSHAQIPLRICADPEICRSPIKAWTWLRPAYRSTYRTGSSPQTRLCVGTDPTRIPPRAIQQGCV